MNMLSCAPNSTALARRAKVSFSVGRVDEDMVLNIFMHSSVNRLHIKGEMRIVNLAGCSEHIGTSMFSDVC